jgi:broad specificity phosphatase PhoE
MKNIEEIKAQIKKTLVECISEVKSVISITFVGSFESATDLRLISDIDIIVIVDQLTQPIFNEIEKNAGRIKGEDIFLPGYQIRLNMSFGPLKFNDEKTAVFHLMIYDVEGHRKHVIESPFTCLDWEFFPAIFGKNLKDIYSAKGVQLEDLMGTRRGMEAYLDDLKQQTISYRAYDFSSVKISEQIFTHIMDDRHQKEYAYHVIKFLMLNLIKIIRQTNQRFSAQELSEEFGQLNPAFRKHTQFFLALHFWKYDQQREPKLIFEQLEEFIQDLSFWYKNLNETLPTLSFIRHGKTALNDGSFLGVGRNPDILPLESNEIPTDEFDSVYTGTLQRTISTGAALQASKKTQDPLLDEINYGSVEGLLFSELPEKYPDLVAAWERKEDPKFPGGGESQQDVADRLARFISTLNRENKVAIVTHNVVIRALIGNAYDLPIHTWFKLNPGHVEKHNFRFFENKLIPALTKEQRIRYKDI